VKKIHNLLPLRDFHTQRATNAFTFHSLQPHSLLKHTYLERDYTPHLTIVQNPYPSEVEEATVTKEETRNVHLILVNLHHRNYHAEDQADSKILRQNETNFDNRRWMELSQHMSSSIF
jgi:hypothetical protein